MVRFVHDHEPYARTARQLDSMALQEFRRRQDDIHRAVRHARQRRTALFGRRFARQYRRAHAKRFERLGKMERLVGNERPQWVHEYADLAIAQGKAGGMDLERKGLPAAGRHDGKRGLAARKRLEHALLRFVQFAIADERTDDRLLEATGVFACRAFPHTAVLVQCSLVRFCRLRVLGAVGAQLGIARRVQIGHEPERICIQAPFVDLHFEGSVHHLPTVHKAGDVGTMEHDGRDRRAAIGQHAREMVLVRAHRPTVRKHDIARQIARNRVFLAEGRKRLKLPNRLERQLVQAYARVDVDARMEAFGRQPVHVVA